MHVHPRTSPENLLPATPLPVATKREAAQTASAQPTMTGLYAQSLKNGRKSSSGTENDSSSPVSDGESSVTSNEQASSSAGGANAGLDSSALRTYTAAGALSKPPSVAGEVFQTTV